MGQEKLNASLSPSPKGIASLRSLEMMLIHDAHLAAFAMTIRAHWWKREIDLFRCANKSISPLLSERNSTSLRFADCTSSVDANVGRKEAIALAKELRELPDVIAIAVDKFQLQKVIPLYELLLTASFYNMTK